METVYREVSKKLDNEYFYHNKIKYKFNKKIYFHIHNVFSLLSFKELTSILLYIILILLDALNKGIYYKLELHPTYSLVLNYTENKEVSLLNKNFTTNYTPVFNLKVAKYDKDILDHDKYYEGMIIDKVEEYMKYNIINNVKNMIKILLENIEDDNFSYINNFLEHDKDLFINVLYQHSIHIIEPSIELYNYYNCINISENINIIDKLKILRKYINISSIEDIKNIIKIFNNSDSITFYYLYGWEDNKMLNLKNFTILLESEEELIKIKTDPSYRNNLIY